MQRGLFSRGSMFSKVIQRTLDPAQREQREAQEKERLEFAYQSAIKLTISELEKSVLLLDDQRHEMMDLLTKAGPPNVVGQYMNYYVLYRLAQSQQRLKEILKPGQQKALTQALNQGQAMGQFLKQNGIID
jgi:predicted type IV restriction endonuclease